MNLDRDGAPMQYDAFEPQLIARHDRPPETGLVDAAEEEELFLAVGHVAQSEDGRALGHGFDDEDAGHDRIAGKVTLEKLLVGGDVFQSDDSRAVGIDLEDAIDQQHRIAMRQQLHDFGDSEDAHFFSVLRRVIRRIIASRRANWRNGIAGMPMTFSPSATSSSTALLAATWTRLPMVRWPPKPDWPATTT